jgi:hypothetical protein
MDPTIKQSLQALFACFPARDSGSPEQAASGFLMAIDGVEPEHIATAARRFIAGRVTRQNNAFLPSTAEFAIEARRVQDEARVARYVALPQPEPRIPSQEERSRVQELMDKLARSIDNKPKNQITVTADDELEAIASAPIRVTNGAALIKTLSKKDK